MNEQLSHAEWTTGINNQKITIDVAKGVLLDMMQNEPPVDVGMPRDKQTIFTLCCDGEIVVSTWYNSESQKRAYDRGSIFLTRSEAVNVDRYRLSFNKIKRHIDRQNTLNNWSMPDNNYASYAILNVNQYVVVSCIVQLNKLVGHSLSIKSSLEHLSDDYLVLWGKS